jgi:hypothetical protein
MRGALPPAVTTLSGDTTGGVAPADAPSVERSPVRSTPVTGALAPGVQHAITYYEHVEGIPLFFLAGRAALLDSKLLAILPETRSAIADVCSGHVSDFDGAFYAMLRVRRLESSLPQLADDGPLQTTVRDGIFMARDSLLRSTFAGRRLREKRPGDEARFRALGSCVVVPVSIDRVKAQALASALADEWKKLGGGFSTYAAVDTHPREAKREYLPAQRARTRSVPAKPVRGFRSPGLVADLDESLRSLHPEQLGKLTCLVCYALRQDESSATTFARHYDGEIEGVATLPIYTVTIMVQGPRYASALHVFGEADDQGAPVIHAYAGDGRGFLFPSTSDHATVPGMSAYLRPPGVMKVSLHYGAPGGEGPAAGSAAGDGDTASVQTRAQRAAKRPGPGDLSSAEKKARSDAAAALASFNDIEDVTG